MATPPLKLPTLPSGIAIVNPETGAPTVTFQQWWFEVANSIEYSVNGIALALEAAGIALAAADVALDAADEAQTAADNAQTSTNTLSDEQSLAQSGCENPSVPPLLSADSTGQIIISTHDRRYGNGTVVSVTGDTLATAYVNPDAVYVFYSDPSRAGGAVTYQTSLDPTDAVQTGSIHSVGVVTVPAAGLNQGQYVTPPGVLLP